MTILHVERDTGEGQKAAPWFWTVRGNNALVVDDKNDQEFVEAIRVEWFRGREHYRRWQEEDCWLRREIASMLFSFKESSEVWTNHALSDYAKRNAGYQSYCYRQSDIFLGLLTNGLGRSEEPLNATPSLEICRRATKELAKPL
ncbi:hypothetical protein RSAG8_02825, partial [Rhizoctonia solani AG-8 WAC10335]